MTTHTNGSIERLRAELAGQVIAPSGAPYDEARSVFYSAIDRKPQAIVRPVDTDEVAHVVSFARESGLELAVRSGGHSGAGHGTSDGGIVLDLSLMKRLELDPAEGVAWAETGLTAGEVTNAAAGYGLGISLGDTGSVGIGGLTLGGGVGLMVRKHGLTIDALRAAELVTADGRLLRVDHKNHPDLFWAIRGGGGNFGVATRFEFRLNRVDAVTGGMLILPAAPDTISGFVAVAEAAPEELSTIANVMQAPPLPFIPVEHHGKLVVLAMLVHVGPSEEGERAFAPFRELATPIADLLRPMSYSEIYPPDQGHFGLSMSMRTLFVDSVDRDLGLEIIDRLRASTAQTAAVQLRVLGGAMARVPVEWTAVAHRRSRIMANAVAAYAAPDEMPVHEAWVSGIADALRQSDGGAYVNFLGDEGEGRVRAAYPGITWDRLVGVKRRYDPTNLFRLNQNIPPASGGEGLAQA
jgi:FAD binding domain/Berberine and berberine like